MQVPGYHAGLAWQNDSFPPVVDVLTVGHGDVVRVEGQGADAVAEGDGIAQRRIDIVPTHLRVGCDKRAEVLQPIHQGLQPRGLCDATGCFEAPAKLSVQASQAAKTTWVM